MLMTLGQSQEMILTLNTHILLSTHLGGYLGHVTWTIYTNFVEESSELIIR